MNDDLIQELSTGNNKVTDECLESVKEDKLLHSCAQNLVDSAGNDNSRELVGQILDSWTEELCICAESIRCQQDKLIQQKQPVQSVTVHCDASGFELELLA